MYFTDILILLGSAFLLIGLPDRWQDERKNVTKLVLFALGFSLLLHFLLDHDRWQMVSAYVLALVAAIVAIRRFRRKEVPARRTWVRAAFTLGALVLLTFATIPPAAFPVYELPLPTGPEKVGVRDIMLTDTSRQDPFSPKKIRKITVRAFYPAAGNANGERHHVLSATGAHEMSAALAGRRGAMAFMLNHLSKVRGYGLRDAAFKNSNRPLPVLIFSHGFSGYVGQNTAMLEDLASHGYLVLSIGHSGDAGVVEFDDGTVYPFKRFAMNELAGNTEVAELTRAMAEETDPAKYHEVIARVIELTEPAEKAARIWAVDHAFVTDQLLDNGLGFPVGAIDKSRIGHFGHSLGGAASAQACLMDDRCAAAVNFDGMQYGDLTKRDLNIPFLMYYSDHPNQGMLFNDIMYRSEPGNKGDNPLYFYIHKGVKHLDGSELTMVLSPFFKSMLPENPLLGSKAGVDAVMTDNAVIRGFFDEYLRGRKGAFQKTVSAHKDVQPWQGRLPESQ